MCIHVYRYTGTQYIHTCSIQQHTTSTTVFCRSCVALCLRCVCVVFALCLGCDCVVFAFAKKHRTTKIWIGGLEKKEQKQRCGSPQSYCTALQHLPTAYSINATIVRSKNFPVDSNYRCHHCLCCHCLYCHCGYLGYHCCERLPILPIICLTFACTRDCD